MKETVYARLSRVLGPRYSVSGWADMSDGSLIEDIDILEKWIEDSSGKEGFRQLYQSMVSRGREEKKRREAARC